MVTLNPWRDTTVSDRTQRAKRALRKRCFTISKESAGTIHQQLMELAPGPSKRQLRWGAATARTCEKRLQIRDKTEFTLQISCWIVLRQRIVLKNCVELKTRFLAQHQRVLSSRGTQQSRGDVQSQLRAGGWWSPWAPLFPKSWALLWASSKRDPGPADSTCGRAPAQSRKELEGEAIPAGSPWELPWAGTTAALSSQCGSDPPHPLEPSRAPAAVLPAHLALLPALVELKYLISFGISIFRVVFFFSILLFSFLFAFGSFLPFCCCLFVLLFIICCFFFLLRKQTVTYLILISTLYISMFSTPKLSAQPPSTPQTSYWQRWDQSFTEVFSFCLSWMCYREVQNIKAATAGVKRILILNRHSIKLAKKCWTGLYFCPAAERQPQNKTNTCKHQNTSDVL